MRRIILGISLLMVCFGIEVQAQSSPPYAYSTEENNRMFQHLITHRDTAIVNPIIRAIKAQPDQFIPPVLFAFSKVLHERGKAEIGLYYFCLAQFRARYNANMAVEDLQAYTHKMVNIYEANFGRFYERFAVMYPQVFSTTIHRVIKYVNEHQSAYNLHWIYLDGIGHSQDNTLKKLTQPQADWPEIKRETLRKYRGKNSAFFDADFSD